MASTARFYKIETYSGPFKPGQKADIAKVILEKVPPGDTELGGTATLKAEQLDENLNPIKKLCEGYAFYYDDTYKCYAWNVDHEVDTCLGHGYRSNLNLEKNFLYKRKINN